MDMDSLLLLVVAFASLLISSVASAGVHNPGDDLLLHTSNRGHRDHRDSQNKVDLKYDGAHLLGKISVGGTDYMVALSFSSSSMWIFEEKAQSTIVSDDFKHVWYERNSDSGNGPFQMEYLDGSIVTGKSDTATVKVGDAEMPTMTFGVADMFEVGRGADDYDWRTRMDGVLGLGLGHHAPYESADVLPPLLSILFSGFVGLSPRLSVHLSKDKETGELLLGDKTGELLIGTVNDKKYHHGSLTYVHATAPGWLVTFDSFQMGENVLAEEETIEVNLGSNSLWAPRDVIQGIIASTKGEAKWDAEQFTVTIDCDKRDGLPDLVFKFDNVPHKFKAHEYFPEFLIPGYSFKERKCTLFMLPSEGLPDGSTNGRLNPQQRWSLGVPFFKKFYTVYEKEDILNPFSWRVGFAVAKDFD